MRRFLIILAALIVIVGLGAAVYFLYFNTTPSLVVDTANPFGTPAGGTTSTGGGSVVQTSTNTDATVGAPAATAVTTRLFEISTGPVVPGVVAFVSSSTLPGQAVSTTTPPTPDTQINYALRESGNLFSYLFHAQKSTRIVNKTIPGVEEASWLPTGALAYLRYLGSEGGTQAVDTYALPVDGSSGYFLSRDIEQVFATASSTIFTLASASNGSIGTVSKSDGTGGKTAFSTSLSDIRVASAGKAGFVLYTKATALQGGYAFLANGSTLTRLAGPLPGLVALPSPQGNWLVFSYTDNNALKTSLLNMKTHEVIPLPIATIADKCAWSNDESNVYCGVPIPGTVSSATYPDDWYQGAASFSDRIWKVNVSGRYAELVLDFQGTTKSALDATSLAIDPKSDILVFLNKRDGALWAYDL